jgi:hypothetical protein
MFISACGNAVAATFETHSRITLSGGGYVVSTPWSSSFTGEYFSIAEESAVFADPYTGGEGPYASISSAAAFASPLAIDFLWVGASAVLGYSGASALAEWRDVTYYGDSGAVGSLIRLNFSVEAELGGLVGSRSYIYVFGGTNLSDEIWESASQQLGLVQFTDAGVFNPETLRVDPNPVLDITGPWDTYYLLNGKFFGTTHLDVPYDEKFGGYSWQIAVFASSGAQYSSGFASSLDSVGLTAVTDLQGNAIRGLTFDSGMTYVPEVPSMYLVAGAGLVLFAYARWRSVRSSAAAL